MRQEGDEASPFMTCMNVINSITHWLLGAVAMTAIVFATVFPGSSHLVQHVYLCTIGYVVMMAQAVLTFNPNNGWSRNIKYQDKKVIHWVMQVIGAILALTGSIIRITNLTNHFTTPHGILGFTAMVLTVVSLVGGVAGLYMKKTTLNKILHSCSGSLTLTAAFVCLCLGFDKWIFRNMLGATTADVVISLTVVGLIGTLFSASFTSYNRIINP